MAESGDRVIKLEPNKGSDGEIDSHDHVSSHLEKESVTETIHNLGDTDSDTKQHGDGPQSDPKMSTKVDKGQENENGQTPKGLTGEIQHHEQKDAQKKAQEVKQENNESIKRKSENDQDSSHEESVTETIHNLGDTDSDTKQHGDGPQSDPKMSTKVDKGQENENGQRPKGLTGEIQHHEQKDAQKKAQEVKQENNESIKRKSENDQDSSHEESVTETIHNLGDTDSDTKQHGDGPQSDPKMSTKVDKGQENENGQRPKGLTGEIQHHEQKDAQKKAQEVKQENNESIKRKSENDQDSSHEGLIGKIEEGEQEDERDDIHVHEQDGIQEHEQDGIQEVNESKMIWWLIPVVIVLLALVYPCHHSTPPVQKDIDVVDVFIERMAKVESSFPNQRPELWKRSRIHISRHLKTVNPTEPVSLILTSGHGTERTLGCLAQRLADSFSGTLNSSVLNIDGKGKTLQDSDQVKLEIDSDLRKAFEGKTLAAVIHRFEELPPGSSLIFYRYCDHENAAYKKVLLVFTVMLDALVEIPYNASLAGIEDMVHDQIKRKFVSSDKSAVFNQMDVDKLSGLWSRISHLILPVARVERIEQQGCGSEGESF